MFKFIKRNQTRQTRALQWSTLAQMMDWSVMHTSERGISEEKYCGHDIIVSLTTYDRRLHSVYLTIESIMQQTVKPNRIILWLADSLQKEELPCTLQRQMERGLEVRYCKDIRSYKKLIPSLKLFPDDAIITADDDLLYKIDMVERLVRAYRDNPTLIYFNRGHRIKLGNDGKAEKYTHWSRVTDYEVSPLNFPTTGQGTLFPPHCFNEEVFNEEVFMGICSHADDIWFKAMSLYNGVSCRKIPTHSLSGDDQLENIETQDLALFHFNLKERGNDRQLKAVFEKYGLYDKLRG